MTPAISIQRGKGKGRDQWKIRAFLSTLIGPEGKTMSMSAVAVMAKTYPQVAQETIRGTRNHSRVLEVLEQLGCPRAYLYGEEPEKTLGRAA